MRLSFTLEEKEVISLIYIFSLVNVNAIFTAEGKVNGCAQSLFLLFVALTLSERSLGK